MYTKNLFLLWLSLTLTASELIYVRNPEKDSKFVTASALLRDIIVRYIPPKESITFIYEQPNNFNFSLEPDILINNLMTLRKFSIFQYLQTKRHYGHLFSKFIQNDFDSFRIAKWRHENALIFVDQQTMDEMVQDRFVRQNEVIHKILVYVTNGIWPDSTTKSFRLSRGIHVLKNIPVNNSITHNDSGVTSKFRNSRKIDISGTEPAAEESYIDKIPASISQANAEFSKKCDHVLILAKDNTKIYARRYSKEFWENSDEINAYGYANNRECFSTVQLLDTWSGSKFKSRRSLYTEKGPWKKNFCEARISYTTHGETDCLKGGENVQSGLCMNVSKILAEKLKIANWTYVRCHPGDVTQQFMESEEPSLIFLADASGHYLRVHNYRLSTYFMYEQFSALMLKSSWPIERNSRLNVNVKIVELAAAVLVGVVIFMVAICKASQRFLGMKLDCMTVALNAWQILLAVSIPREPRHSAARIPFLAWAFLALFLTTLYSQNLSSEFTLRPRTALPTLEFLETRGGATVLDEGHFFHDERLIDRTPNETQVREKFAAISNRYMIADPSRLAIFPEDLDVVVLDEKFWQPVFYRVLINGPTREIDDLLLRIVQSGILTRRSWYAEHSADNHSQTRDSAGAVRSLRECDLFGVFRVFSIMLILSVFVFAAENMTGRYFKM